MLFNISCFTCVNKSVQETKQLFLCICVIKNNLRCCNHERRLLKITQNLKRDKKDKMSFQYLARCCLALSSRHSWGFQGCIFFFFGCVGSSLLRMGFSLVVASGDYCSLRWAGFSLRWLLLLWSAGSRREGFSSCGTRAQQLWLAGLVAPRHVESSRTRDRIHIP